MRILALVAAAAFASVASAGFYEDFNAGGAFPWDVVDYNGNSAVLGWDYNYNIFDDGVPRGNFSSGDGGAAHVDTDAVGSGGAGPYDIAILSPWSTVDGDNMLEYVLNFQAIGDALAVEVTTDGTTWDVVRLYDDEDIGGFPTFPYDQDEPIGQAEAYDLSAYAGEDVRVQFRYFGDGWNWWAQVDNVRLGVPTPGALALLGLAGLARRRRR
ncbi:MAG: choice-of-anchor J domain-containing protein [Planctomycetota bacterium]|nr:choice-of-anchor J domain-containing protein [Planctomycetota bacterium]